MTHHWHSDTTSANRLQDPEEPVPTYQYACTACGHQLEAVQSFADEPLTQCPSCEGRLRKLFNSVGIVFKGPGFYRTDSRSTGSDPASGDKPAAAKSESSSSTGGDSATKNGGGSNSGDSGSSAKPAATAAKSGTPATSSASSSGS
jgi:putative FmdB family regulatory protein